MEKMNPYIVTFLTLKNPGRHTNSPGDTAATLNAYWLGVIIFLCTHL